MMLSYEGYFDGTAVKTLKAMLAKKNQKVIITVLDEFIDEGSLDAAKPSAYGILSKYANPALIEKENGAWERAMVKKHEQA